MAYDEGGFAFVGIVPSCTGFQGSLARSTKPERVLTPEQWAAFQQYLNSATEENTDG